MSGAKPGTGPRGKELRRRQITESGAHIQRYPSDKRRDRGKGVRVFRVPEQLSGVILAGGRSLRMGRDKAWLEAGGQPLLQRQLGLLAEVGIRDLAVAAGPEDRDPLPPIPADIPLLRDLQPGLGPLAGIESGLRWARSLHPEGWTLCLAVDLPEMSTPWLRRLMTGIASGSGCVPRHQGRLEPLAAIYPNRAWAVARAHLEHPPENRKASVQGFCHRGLENGWMIPWETSPEDQHALINWNSPSDWTLNGSGGGTPPNDQP